MSGLIWIQTVFDTLIIFLKEFLEKVSYPGITEKHSYNTVKTIMFDFNFEIDTICYISKKGQISPKGRQRPVCIDRTINLKMVVLVCFPFDRTCPSFLSKVLLSKERLCSSRDCILFLAFYFTQAPLKCKIF